MDRLPARLVHLEAVVFRLPPIKRLFADAAALDLRELTAGQTVELDTAHEAFTVERTDYYHVELTQESTAFDTHRGGGATVTPAGSTTTPVAANQQVVMTGTDSPRLEMAAAHSIRVFL